MTVMPGFIERHLAPVRRRQRLRSAWHGAVRGLAAGALAGAAAEALHRAVGGPQVAFALLAAGPVLGAAWRGAMDHPLSRAAAAVDARYNLKDRVASALAFAARLDDQPLRALAIADAERRLRQIDARHVVPIGRPPWLRSALAAVTLLLLLILLPTSQPAAAALPSPPIDGIVAEADAVAEQMRQLAKQARQEEDAEVQKLAEALAERAEALREPGVDVRDALAELSQMQAVLAEQRARYNTAVTDAHLSKLGEAMAQNEAWQDAGAALKDGDFDSAAAAMEKLGPTNDPRRDEAASRAMADEAAAMRRSGLSAMSAATMRFTEAVRRGDRAGSCDAACGMAAEVRTHAQRSRMARLLAQQMARLNESKGYCAACQGAKPGGKSGGASAAPSDKPSNTWGLGESGNPTGDPTSLGGQRQADALSGEVGDGPVDIETGRSPEARQRAGRSYREVYDDYQRMAESVLETEPIPMGHRQVIRRYFESIRPDHGE